MSTTDKTKIQRNMDGVYFRVERDGRWQNVCYSDMTADERKAVIYDRLSDNPAEDQARYYRRLAEIMADQLYDVAEQLGVVCE